VGGFVIARSQFPSKTAHLNPAKLVFAREP